MEKEERYNYVFDQDDGDIFIYDLKEDKRIDDLSQCAYILNKYEAKLAESENLNKRLQQVIDKLRDKEFAGETLVNAVNAVYEPVYQNKCDEVEQLKKQLQEEKYRNKKLNHEAQKYYEDAYCNGIQNQKAIAELEKVKELLIKNKHIALGAFDIAKRKESEIEVCRLDVAIYEIDQQIAELKGEK